MKPPWDKELRRRFRRIWRVFRHEIPSSEFGCRHGPSDGRQILRRIASRQKTEIDRNQVKYYTSPSSAATEQAEATSNDSATHQTGDRDLAGRSFMDFGQGVQE